MEAREGGEAVRYC